MVIIQAASGVLLTLLLAACAPLPGRTLDPLTIGSVIGSEGPPPQRDQWIGRYEDTRGSGELVVQFRRTAGGVEGIWQLRTGGDGVLTGTRVPNTSIVKFTLASQDAACFVLLEGVGELTADRWTATYSGRDCQGTVSNGRFSLTKR